MPSPFPQAIWESVTEAIGESDATLAGQLYTFLAAPLGPDDTTIVVDSTHKWPVPGVVSVGGEAIPYNSKTATTFLADSRAPSAVLQLPGTCCYDQTKIRSEVDTVRSLLHFGRSTGTYLRELLRNFGLPVPNGFQDSQLRAYGSYCAHVPAGPTKVVAGALDAVLNGPLFTGSVAAPNVLTMDVGQAWPNIGRRMVKILAPSANAGIYRVRGFAGQAATLERAAGLWYDGAVALVNEAAVAFEVMPFDVWHDPETPGNFYVDVIEFQSLQNVKGSAFLQSGEPATSSDATHVTVQFEPTQVLGVWLAGDVERTGTNYWTGGAFAGKVLTLGAALPNPQEPVLVDYGSIKYTAQVLVGPAVDGTDYYPFYLADPSAYVAPVLDVVRAAGYLPILVNVPA